MRVTNSFVFNESSSLVMFDYMCLVMVHYMFLVMFEYMCLVMCAKDGALQNIFTIVQDCV